MGAPLFEKRCTSQIPHLLKNKIVHADISHILVYFTDVYVKIRINLATTNSNKISVRIIHDIFFPEILRTNLGDTYYTGDFFFKLRVCIIYDIFFSEKISRVYYGLSNLGSPYHTRYIFS